MKRLSSSIDSIKPNYTVVVVGSGYGGGISASRLARAGQDVCILERGKEFLPGDFPETFSEIAKESQYDFSKGHLSSERALFDFNINDGMSALVGCGLGGTSLINANVVIEVDPRVFNKESWPKNILNDLDHGIKKGIERAVKMLKPNPYPDGGSWPHLRKLEALKDSAIYMDKTFYPVDIAVTFDAFDNDINHVGVKQTPCILCGDCVSGCNHTSKNTVQMNYLPDAFNHGAEIFTSAKVRYVEKSGEKWLVHFNDYDPDSEKYDTPDKVVEAKVVILAAGTLGSTEILLRSRDEGLSVSDMLGKGFSGNGDFLGFSYNADQKINGIGMGDKKPDPKNPVGPCITGIIDTRKESKDYKEGMSIEEGSIPGALSPLIPEFFSIFSLLRGRDTDTGVIDRIKELYRWLISAIFRAYHGAVQNTQTYLVMTHDDHEGVLALDDDRLRIIWPNAGKEPIYEKVKNYLYKATEALGGVFLTNPVWAKLTGYDLITVHCLGGCIMGEESEDGVVNDKGQVFSNHDGDGVHEGLYVLDGSIIPTSLGTNPLLTISAISERNIALLAKDYGWTIKEN